MAARHGQDKHGLPFHKQVRGFGGEPPSKVHPHNTSGNFSTYGEPDVANVTPNNKVVRVNNKEKARPGSGGLNLHHSAQNSKGGHRTAKTNFVGHKGGAHNKKGGTSANQKLGLGSGTGKKGIKRMNTGGKPWQ